MKDENDEKNLTDRIARLAKCKDDEELIADLDEITKKVNGKDIIEEVNNLIDEKGETIEPDVNGGEETKKPGKPNTGPGANGGGETKKPDKPNNGPGTNGGGETKKPDKPNNGPGTNGGEETRKLDKPTIGPGANGGGETTEQGESKRREEKTEKVETVEVDDEEGGTNAFTFEELVEKCKNPPLDIEENRPEKLFESIKRQRNAELGKAVKQVYEDKCAVCRLVAYDLKGNPEAQWAHIKPVRKPHNGPDDIRNGLALCRFHHWAFDKGLFAISDDFNIIVKEGYPESGDYDKITEFKVKKIFIPSDIFKPHIKFLKYHRVMHGFEGV